MFREVRLPKIVPGRLYLHSMPGRREKWEKFAAEASRRGFNVIVCLTSEHEIEKKSPSYAETIKRNQLGLPRECFPIPDFGVPKDRESYATFVTRIANQIQAGDTVLVHCGGGIGRTGTFAACLLVALGLSTTEAKKDVREAGSRPETPLQSNLISWYEKVCSRGTMP